jgi:hypothetical protein
MNQSYVASGFSRTSTGGQPGPPKGGRHVLFGIETR